MMFTFKAICNFAIEFLSLSPFAFVLALAIIYFGFNVFHNLFIRR